MKRKTIEQIMNELEDSLNSEIEFVDYITGNEFEAWLKELKDDSKEFSVLRLLDVFNDLLGFNENNILIPVNSIIGSIKDCGYTIKENTTLRGTRKTHKIIYVYAPTGQHVYNIWINISVSETEVYVDAIYNFRNHEYLFRSNRMEALYE